MKSRSHLIILVGLTFNIALASCAAPASPPSSSSAPTAASSQPTEIPTISAPTVAPTAEPTTAPPTAAPTTAPTLAATSAPTVSAPATVRTIAPTTAASPSAPTPTIAAVGTPPEPPTGDLLAFLRPAYLANLDASSFRATQAFEFAGGSSNQLIIEYVAPDRMHVVSGDNSETIVIKGVGGWQTKAGVWEPMEPGSEGFLFAAIEPQAIEASVDMIDASSIRFLETDTIGGQPMFVFEYIVPSQSVYQPDVTHKAWVGALDKRVHRVETRTPKAPDSQDVDLLTIVYEFDIPITIEPPM